jgi:hypothetical protein
MTVRVRIGDHERKLLNRKPAVLLENFAVIGESEED